MSHGSMREAEEHAVTLLRDLLRIDTSNFGDGSGPGEAAAAEYAQSALTAMGIEAERFVTTGGLREGVVARVRGTDPTRPSLLVHGHLDVVPAIASDWSVPPFGAEVIDGMVWGRGAVDMKDFDAMVLAVMGHWQRTGLRPDRDIVLLFTPDEEAGGTHGAHWMVRERPDIFEGVGAAVGEVGGFSITLRDDLRLYAVQTAEKGLAWMRLVADGTAGHGSLVNRDNAVTAVARAVASVGEHRFPVRVTPAIERFLGTLSDALGVTLDAADPDQLARTLGPLSGLVGASLQHSANPTMLEGGYKANVIPGTASAVIDGRYLPGGREDFLATIDGLIGPGVRREVLHEDIATEADVDHPLIDVMAGALREDDPGALVSPYMIPAGTDGKAFSTLGIQCFGFVPLRLPAGLDFAGLFHGVDERVPIESLQFGVRVLDRFLRSA